MRTTRRVGVACLLAFAAAAVILIATATGQSSSPPAAIGALASRIAPGAAANVVQDPRGDVLQIQLPDSIAYGGHSADIASPFDLADGGWRARLIADGAGLALPRLTRFDASDSTGRRPDGATNYWQGLVRASPGDVLTSALPLMGAVSPGALRSQLDANLEVLRGGLPADAWRGVTVETIDVGGLQAFVVSLEVRSLSALEDHLGDIINGPMTGLAGGLDATVAGFALRVSDDDGWQIGSWVTPLDGAGTLMFDPRMAPPQSMPLTLAFRVLTGGPPAMTTGLGASSARPVLEMRRGQHRVRVSAGYVGCANSSCPGGPDVRPRGCLGLHARDRVTFKTDASAETVELLLTRRTSSQDARKPRVFLGRAHRTSDDGRRWAIRLPRRLGRATVAEVTVLYPHAPEAVFYVGVRTTSRCPS